MAFPGVFYVLTLKPKEGGNFEKTKAYMREALVPPTAEEKGTHMYQFLEAEDGSGDLNALEWYSSNEALLVHLDNVAEIAGPIGESYGFTGVVIYGDASEAVVNAFKGLGCTVRCFKQFAGFGFRPPQE